MTPPEDTQGKGNTDLNVQHRTMEQIMLDHMKLCHPEWLADLKESGELDDFIADHVERAGDQYGRSVEKGTQPLLAREIAVRDHLLIDPLGDCQKYHYGSDNNDEPVTQKRAAETAEVIQARAERVEATGKVYFLVEGFCIEWNSERLRVQVIEYHPEVLVLGWDYLRKMASAARGGPSDELSKSSTEHDEEILDGSPTFNSDFLIGGGMRDLPVQGFCVYWGNPGLTVEAIDYHSTELLLGWDYVLSLAEAVSESKKE